MHSGLCLAFAAVAAAVASPCPNWTVPGGTYSGSLNANNVCVYSNIRFAAPPVGDLRFAAPADIPRGSLPLPPGPNPSCIQMNSTKCIAGLPLVGGEASCYPEYFGQQSEDCLFLDVYVPVEAFTWKKPLPVVIWYYGGAYLFGSKTQYDPSKLPFYAGDGFVDAATKSNEGAQKSVIFVAGNYRLGAFGWLAGSYMEKNGQPNAGLLDQRMVMKFVNQHISGVMGDPTSVSVWGESAGASSILHHLTMPQNIQKPLFQKALLQSPAYQWMWDRAGSLNDSFTDFAQRVASLVPCQQADMKCIRSANTSVLTQANQDMYQYEACEGIMPVGPSVDGNLIPYLAPYSLATGKAVSLDTIAVSHVDNEVPYSSNTEDVSFVPLPIRKSPHSEDAFQDFLEDIFTGDKYAAIRTSVSQKYPLSSYTDQIARAVDVIRDSSFTCNTRFIADHYIDAKSSVYAMDYSVFMKYCGTIYNGSVHASDLVPAFENKQTNYTGLLECLLNVGGTKAGFVAGILGNEVSPPMQDMFTKHAIWGDPNHNCPNCAYQWLQARKAACPGGAGSGNCLWNVLKPQTDYTLCYPTVKGTWEQNAGADVQTGDSTCSFWNDIASKISLSTSDQSDGMRKQLTQQGTRLQQAALDEEL